jgi:curved DNA-binding protein CbpA
MLSFRKNMNPDIDYYKILNLTNLATEKEIKKSFYALAKQYHPDTQKVPEYQRSSQIDKFKIISGAYEILSDLETKRDYDILREARKPPKQRHQQKEDKWTYKPFTEEQSKPKSENGHHFKFTRTAENKGNRH